MNGKILAFGLILTLAVSIGMPGAFAHHVSKEVHVGRSPMKMTIEEGHLYVSSLGEREVSVIDIRTDEVVKTITTSAGAVAVEAVLESDVLYVATFESGGIDVYELSTGKYVKTIDLPDSEITVWHSPGDDRQEYLTLVTGGVALDHMHGTGILYVANYNANYIAAIDTKTNEVLEKIPVSRHPYALKVDQFTGKVLVASLAGNEITFLSPIEEGGKITHTISSTLKTGTAPWGIAIDEMEHLAYITHRGEHHVAVLNTIDEKMIDSIYVGDDTQAISVDSEEHQIYVTYLQQNKIAKIDGRTNQIVGTIESGALAWDVVVDSASHKVYATVRGSDTVLVMGPRSMAASIPIVTMQTPIAYVGEMFVHGQDVEVFEATVDIESKALVLRTEADDGGKLSMSIPRTILDSKDSQNADKAFVVYADQKIVGQDSLSADESVRVISVQIPKGTESVTISGTTVIPEFGSIVAIILIGGITSAIIMTRRQVV